MGKRKRKVSSFLSSSESIYGECSGSLEVNESFPSESLDSNKSLNGSVDTYPLSPAEVVEFQDKGFILLKHAFDPSLAQTAREFLWDYMKEHFGILRDDSKSWVERKGIPVCFKDGHPWSDILKSTRLNHAIDQLCGGPCSWKKFGLGWWIIGFPGFHHELSTWGAAGNWHIDGNYFRHKLTSQESGILPLFLFSSIVPGAGGTALCVGSHKVASKVLLDAGSIGLRSSVLSREVLRRIELDEKPMHVVQVVGDAGDVMLVHPLLLHARSKNIGPKEERFVRFLCSPGVQLTRQKRILISSGKQTTKINDHNQSDCACLSPVEQAIKDAIIE